MKIEINESLFARMINSVKNCVPVVDINRTILTYIKLKISNDKITAYGCDGYRAARTTIELEEPTESEFECFIKPITFKPSKSGKNPVVIHFIHDPESNKNITTLEVITKTGKVKYYFEQPKENYADIDKIYDSASYDRKIGMNPNFVKLALTALSQASNTHRPCVVFECGEKANASFKLSVKDKGFVNEQLILPIRLDYDK